MNDLLTAVQQGLSDADEVWIDPRRYELGKIKDFYVARRLFAAHGIALAYIVDAGHAPTHPWLFYKAGTVLPAYLAACAIDP